MPPLCELNLDGIVGPTHNYAGLSFGNVASAANEGLESSPRAAALQGLEKMAFVASLGIEQGYLPPHERPHVPSLRRLGFTGSDVEVIARAAREDPLLLTRCASASAMWVANAATVAPASDCADGRTHLTPANLRSMFHRSIEPPVTARILKAVLPDPARFVHHEPLPATELLGDEGAANHTRLCGRDERAVHLFAYGRSEVETGPKRFPARQTLTASQAVARLHGLDPARTIFARQRAESIDAGVFHNDVISVGTDNVLFLHEHAFAEQAALLDRLVALLPELVVVTVSAREVSVEEAVKSYLFNSQLLALPAGGLALVAPVESQGIPAVNRVLERIVADPTNPIAVVHYRNLRESMRNGGGPACLRLRVPLSDADLAAVAPGCRYEPARHARLGEWVSRHYRESLRPSDLGDPKLLDETRAALDELTRLLGIGSVYDFQR